MSWIQVPLGLFGVLAGVVLAGSVAITFGIRSNPNDMALLPGYGYSVLLIGLSVGTVCSGLVLGRFVPLIMQTSRLSGRLGRLLAGVSSAAVAAVGATALTIAVGVLISGLWGLS